MKRSIIGALLMLGLSASLPAAARDWYALNLDANECLTMARFGQEIMQFGGMPVFSPEALVFWLRSQGASAHATVTNLPRNEVMATVEWRSIRGENLERVFFSSMAVCQLAVAHLIEEGKAAPPGALH